MIAALMFFAIAVGNCLRDVGSGNQNLLIRLLLKLSLRDRNHHDRIYSREDDYPK
jgi:hypothetical protein